MKISSPTFKNKNQISFSSLLNAARFSSDTKMLLRLESIPFEKRWGGRELSPMEVMEELKMLKVSHAEC